jgi:uncharacterized membrane protein YbhN (UPF0104 family)
MGLTLLSLWAGSQLAGTESLLQAMSPSSPFWLVLTAVCLAGAYAVRASRLAIVLDVAMGRGVFGASVLHNLSAAIFPAKIGELSLPVLLKRLNGGFLMTGIGTLAIVRVLDIIGLAGCLLAVSLFYGPAHLPLWLLALSLSLAAAGSICLLGGQVHFRAFAGPPAERGRLARLWYQFGLALHPLSSGRVLRAIVLSHVIWFLVIGAFFMSARAFGMDVNIVGVAMATVASTLATFLPINGLMNIGPAQVAWAGVITTEGDGFGPGMAAAIATQMLALTVMSALAAFTAYPAVMQRREP